ncbi:MAG: T9SS type A sorting domain-containing protein [Melioribacteraceae bacterium]|nr:T9SS type A sorting domain-containing protein [Melioribacteraceae bacterium]
MKLIFRKIFIAALILLLSDTLFAQVESSSLILNRGKLWHTLSYTRSGPPFSNWSDKGIGLDWPGFDPTLISENIGGAASYLTTGGLIVGAKKYRDSVLTVEDWSLSEGSVSEAGSKYKVTSHRKLFGNNGNNWLKEDPNVGEEVIETVWEYNLNYDVDEYQIARMLPVRVKRKVHQWSGSKLDENYIIHEYVIKNISNELRAQINDERFLADTLYGFYAALNYGMHCNSRSWGVLFPSLTSGARNTLFTYDKKRNLIYGKAWDYPETPENDESFGKALSMGPLVRQADGSLDPTGEYLAPAFVGIKLLYASPNLNGDVTSIRQTAWSAGSSSADWSGPFTGIGATESRYKVLEDLTQVANYVEKNTHELMRKSRMWSLMSVGPYDILPGDSIKIVFAEMVDGIPYREAIDVENNPINTVNKNSRDIFYATADRAKFTYDNNLNHPDPPAAPSFSVDYNRENEVVANIITWNDSEEGVADPDDGEIDLEGYILYRSSYLPIGPWDIVDTVFVGDSEFLSGNKYIYTDSDVEIGKSYYYALTVFDLGRDSWSINTSARFSATNSNVVPPMESSIFANRMSEPFVATLPPKETLDEILVVPNPFVIGQGSSRPGEGDQIQFVNIPNPCTIRIYTVRGDLVKTIEVSSGDGAIVSWDQITDFGQFVKSGVYIFHVESDLGTKIGKLAIVR